MSEKHVAFVQWTIQSMAATAVPVSKNSSQIGLYATANNYTATANADEKIQQKQIRNNYDDDDNNNNNNIDKCNDIILTGLTSM